MVLIAQIALGVIIGGLTLGLIVTGFIMWVQGKKERLAIWLFAAGAAIVVMLLLAGLSP